MTAGDPLAYVALGANLGDPAAQVRRAAAAIDALTGVVAGSRLYSSAAQGGPSGQPPFVNAVLSIAAEPWLGAEERLLALLLETEADLGRERRIRWGPRIIDLDLLAVAGVVRLTRDPLLPHPRIEERAFVLAPLLDVAPDWRHPLSGRPARTALSALLERGGSLPVPLPGALLEREWAAGGRHAEP